MIDRIASLYDRLHHGVAPAMATPLEENGYQVQMGVVSQLVEFLIDRGVSGLFVGGTTGEGILLDIEQRKVLHKEAVQAAMGRVPTLVHIGASTTRESVSLAVHAAEVEADALVAVTPYFYPVHDRALLEHYQAITEAVPHLPLFAYDIPHMAVNTVGPDLVKELATRLGSFAGIKTSQRDAQVVRSLIEAMPPKRLVLAGNERLAIGLLGLGADGLISGLSTAIPEPFVGLTRAFKEGDFDTAREYHQVINQLLDLIPSGSRIGAIKSLLVQRGINVGPPVPPRPSPPHGWAGWMAFKEILESKLDSVRP